MYKIIIFALLFSSGFGIDWCSKELDCETEENKGDPEYKFFKEFKNTMCANAKSDGNCLEAVDILTENHKKLLLENHNYFRYRFGSQPAFQNIPIACQLGKLTWDTKLEEMAKEWAMQCPFVKEFCRRPNDVGQIVGVVVSGYGFPVTSVVSIFKNWVQPFEILDKVDANAVEGLIQNFRRGEWDSATQIVWGNTAKVGCSCVSFKITDNKTLNHFFSIPSQPQFFKTLVCNYSPAGNIDGQQVFRTGCNNSGQASSPRPNPSIPVPYPDADPKKVILIPGGELRPNAGERFAEVIVADELESPRNIDSSTTTPMSSLPTSKSPPEKRSYSSSSSSFSFSKIPFTIAIPRLVSIEVALRCYALLLFFQLHQYAA